MVWRVATWKGHARFDGNMDMHGHFLCETCARLVDVDTHGTCDPLREQVKACVAGEIARIDVMISGECEACAARRRAMPLQT